MKFKRKCMKRSIQKISIALWITLKKIYFSWNLDYIFWIYSKWYMFTTQNIDLDNMLASYWWPVNMQSIRWETFKLKYEYYRQFYVKKPGCKVHNVRYWYYLSYTHCKPIVLTSIRNMLWRSQDLAESSFDAQSKRK